LFLSDTVNLPLLPSVSPLIPYRRKQPAFTPSMLLPAWGSSKRVFLFVFVAPWPSAQQLCRLRIKLGDILRRNSEVQVLSSLEYCHSDTHDFDFLICNRSAA
jgi:hypothetical protein